MAASDSNESSKQASLRDAGYHVSVICPQGTNIDVSPYELDGTGTVHSWTVAHHSFSPETAEEGERTDSMAGETSAMG